MPGLLEILGFLRCQLLQTPPVPTTTFAGRTVIITGANTGLGFEAAKQIVHLNASHLILGCRSIDRGEKAKSAIVASIPSSSNIPKVEVWPIDMSSYASVLAFGQRASKTLSCLDAVILNAGVELRAFEFAEGTERTLTINVLSTFLLAQLVLPKLRETAKTQGRNTHLTFVGSMIHLFARDEQLRGAEKGQIFKALSDPARADMGNRYILSKLILTLGVRDFVARTKLSVIEGGAGVVINDVNPGWCKTELFRHIDTGFAQSLALRVMGRTGEVGARTLTHAASAGRETHGKYLSECQVKDESLFVRSEAGRHIQEKLGIDLEEALVQIQAGETD